MKQEADSMTAGWRKWAWLFAFASVWLALRVFWLDGDSGICSMWEYGFHTTDEGYYLGGGKEKFLWGAFNDLARLESPTYGYATGMHWLSYLAYLLFGLSDWAWRLPFVTIAFVAWCLAYRHSAARCGDRIAFPLVLACSSIPMVISYERTACNDVLIGALALIAYCLSAGRGKWRLFVPPLLIGYISVIKPSVWLLLPLFAAGVLEGRKTTETWKDLVIFFAFTGLSIDLWRGVQLLSVLPETAACGCSATEILHKLAAHFAPPSLLDFGALFRGLSSFPSDPSCTMLSGVAALISVVPGALTVRVLILRRWNRRLLLYLAFPVYVAGISVMHVHYAHYFLPLLMFLPVLWTDVRTDLDEGSNVSVGWRRMAIALVVPMAIMGGVLLVVFSQVVRLEVVEAFYSRIHNLPSRNVWLLAAPWLAVTCAVVVGTLTVLRGVRALVKEGAAWLFLAFAAGSVAFAVLPAVRIAPWMKVSASAYAYPLALSLFVSLVFLMLVFGLGPSVERRRVLALFVPTVVVVSYALTPAWRQAAVELVRPVTHINAEVGAEIAKMVEPNAVIIGERATRVMMGQPIRTATTILSEDDPIPTVKALRTRDPKVPLYALADSEHAYNLTCYRKHPEVYRLQKLRTFSMPSFVTGKPTDVYFYRIGDMPIVK